MDLRQFIHTGLTSAVALKLAQGRAAAQEPRNSASRIRRLPSLVTRVLTTPNTGFPSVTPLFSGVFLPGVGAASLVRSESWADFMTQTQTQAIMGYRLACFTTIQNFN